MATYDYDLFVIGAGSGGVRAARIAAQLGARVAIAEERYLGGTCVNVGCIPKKLLVYAAHFGEDFDDAAGFGWSVASRRFDWRALIANKDREIARLNRIYGDLLDTSGAERLESHADLLDEHTIEIDGRRLTSEYVLIASGSWPITPAFPGAELALNSNDFFHLERLPERFLLLGGGYIAVEMAGILEGLGCDVTLVHRGSLFLRGFDDDVRRHLADEMRKKGVDLRFGVNIAAIEAAGEGRRVKLTDGSTVEVDAVLYAIGRAPNTAGLGLENTGVRLGPYGAVLVDDYLRSSAPNIFAVGDVTDRLGLTPVAIAEGQAVAHTLFGGRPTRVDYTGIPTAVFSNPNLATIGMTEEQALAEHGAVDVFRTSFRPLKHTLSGRDERTLMKLVVDRATDRVLGCHMVGADSAEIVQCLAVALKAGATKAHFDATIGLHPTAAEELVTMRVKS